MRNLSEPELIDHVFCLGYYSTMITNVEFDKLYARRGFASQRKYPNEQLIQFLAANFFAIPKNERKDFAILELGCGSGANLWMIAKEGFDAYGLDNSAHGIELCKQLLDVYDVTAHLAVGDFRKLEYFDNYFDAIIDVVSLQHSNLEGHEESYKEIMRCLKPGGKFFSWHLGDKSISFREHKGSFLDAQTVDDIGAGLPLSGNGMTCFLNPEIARKMLSSAYFQAVEIEQVLRTYKQMTQTVEYLAIQATKPIADS